MYSDMIVKFWGPSVPSLYMSFQYTHLVLVQRVDAQHVKGVLLGLLAAELPLALLGASQVVRRVDVARLPLAVDLALELLPPLRLDHLARLRRAVDAQVAGDLGGREGAGLRGPRAFRGLDVAEEAEDVVGICRASVHEAAACAAGDGGRTLPRCSRREAAQAVAAGERRRPESGSCEGHAGVCGRACRCSCRVPPRFRDAMHMI